jgi:hypothetical protein
MTKEEFLALAEKRYEELSKLVETSKGSFYEHEKNFDRIWTGLGHDVLDASTGAKPGDRRKKKDGDALR